MKTIRNRNSMRGHGDRRRYDDRDEFNQSGMDDGWRNEDYYFDRVQERRGYDNPDYSGRNYWPSNEEVRDERYGQYNSYVPALDYGRDYHPVSRRNAVGYGNEGSRSMREIENWRDGGGSGEEGYGGRNADDFSNPRYSNSRDYGWTDFDENPIEDYYYDSSRPRAGGEYNYGDYQSYPSYGARGYSENEWDPRESRRFRNRPQNQGREYGDRHRPIIREKRY